MTQQTAFTFQMEFTRLRCGCIQGRAGRGSEQMLVAGSPAPHARKCHTLQAGVSGTPSSRPLGGCVDGCWVQKEAVRSALG